MTESPKFKANLATSINKALNAKPEDDALSWEPLIESKNGIGSHIRAILEMVIVAVKAPVMRKGIAENPGSRDRVNSLIVQLKELNELLRKEDALMDDRRGLVTEDDLEAAFAVHSSLLDLNIKVEALQQAVTIFFSEIVDSDYADKALNNVHKIMRVINEENKDVEQ